MKSMSPCRFYKPGGASFIFPDAYEGFIADLSPTERLDPLTAYHQREWRCAMLSQHEAVTRTHCSSCRAEQC